MHLSRPLRASAAQTRPGGPTGHKGRDHDGGGREGGVLMERGQEKVMESGDDDKNTSYLLSHTDVNSVRK